MAFVQMLSLFVPPAIYFVLAFFLFHLPIGFCFTLGLIGSFLIGISVCKKIESKVFELDSHTPFIVFAFGLSLIGLSALLVNKNIPIDDQAAFTVFMRAVLFFVLILSYNVGYGFLNKKLRCVGNIWLAALAIIMIATFWLLSLIPFYSLLFLITAIGISILNGFTMVKTNLHVHKSPFVLFKKIDGWSGRHSDIFSDMFFIVFPLAIAIVQLL